MTAVDEVNSALVSKCMDFCQALATQGQAFHFSVAIGPSFSFSLDTRSKALEGPGTKKKVSPSTLRRNAKRREEFLKKRISSDRSSSEDAAATSSVLNCDQCDYKATSEKGLKQHMRMKHRPPSTPEKLRGWNEVVRSPNSSPLLNSREESCRNCEVPFSPGHQCGNEDVEDEKCALADCCHCYHAKECECWKEGPDCGLYPPKYT